MSRRKGGTKKKIRQQVTSIEITVTNPNKVSYNGLFVNSDRIQYRGVRKGQYYKVVKFDIYGKPPGQHEIADIKKQVQAAGGGRSSSSGFESSESRRDTISASSWDEPLTAARSIREAITKRKGR